MIRSKSDKANARFISKYGWMQKEDIQAAFGWENSHVFQFCENELSDPVGYGTPGDGEAETKIIDARRI
jgi:hypothetical protein